MATSIAQPPGGEASTGEPATGAPATAEAPAVSGAAVSGAAVSGTTMSGTTAVATVHPNLHAVWSQLTAAGATGQIVLLDDEVRTAAAAAAAVGVDVGQIVKSLVFAADGVPLLVLTSGAHQADVGEIAASVGAATITRASPEFVRAHTGQPIGGVAPVGHPVPIRTLVDTALAAYGEVWAAGGIPRAVFPTSYDELLRLTGGTPVTFG